MASLGDLVVRVGAEISGFVDSMSTVAEKMNATADQVEKRMDALEGVGRRLAVAGAGLTAAVTLPIVGIGEAALATAGKFEQTQIAFEHFLGSAQSAKNYLADLYEFAKTTPFQITDITQGATKLMAMGFAAKEVTPMLRILGDQLSAVGRMDQLGNIILAFGEVKAKGVASMKEIRQMVTDGVIPVLRYLSEALGVSEGAVIGMLKEKLIDSATLIKATTEGMTRDTGGMMKEQMHSFVGMMTNVKDNVTLTLKAIGDTLIPYAKMFSEFANSALEMVKKIAQGFADLPEPVRAALLAMAALLAVAGPLMTGIGGVLMLLAPLAAAAGMLAAPFLGWTLAIGVTIAALVGLGTWISRNWEPIRVVTLQAWAGISEVWHATIGIAVDWVVGLWTKFADVTKTVWGGISRVVSSVSGFIVDDIKGMWQTVSAIFGAALSLVSKIPGMQKLMSLGDTWKEQTGIVAFNENLKKQSEFYNGIKNEMIRASLAAETLKEAQRLGKDDGNDGKGEKEIRFKPVHWDKNSLDWFNWLRAHMAELEKKTAGFEGFKRDTVAGDVADDAITLGSKLQKMSAFNKPAGLSEGLQGFIKNAFADNILNAYKQLGIETTAPSISRWSMRRRHTS